ncbi:MAG: polyisoprenoid-binding protein [Myxococcales bacterium]|nr:polyisoprenoid-binding protein [Myxococcales bacterium]
MHSSIGFSVRHMMVSKVRGVFKKWEGTLAFDEETPGSSSVEVKIDAGSIDTHEAQRDGHLGSADFLDVAQYPEILFKSSAFTAAGAGQYKVTGELTLHGVTLPLTLDVEYAGRAKHPHFGERAGFSAKGSLDRKDFGLGWNSALDTGGVLVGDTVEISLEIELVKPAA